jgi:MFS family permease
MSARTRRVQTYHTVWGALIFGWISNYMVRTGLAPVLLPIRRELHLTFAQAGWLVTAFFVAYTLMQLPAGYLGDRFGRKALLVAGPLWWGMLSLATAAAHGFWALCAARFLTGLGEGTFFGNDRPVIASVTPAQAMGRGQGISFTGLGIGLTLGVWLGGVIADHLSWRAVFVLFALPALAAGAVIARVVPEPPRFRAPRGGTAAPAHLAFRSRDLWLLTLSAGAVIYALWVVGTWAPAMFHDIGVPGLGAPALLTSLLGIAAVFGLPLMGVLSDRVHHGGGGRKGVAACAILALAAVMGVMGAAVGLRAPAGVLAACVFAAGVLIWGIFAPVYALVGELAPPEIRGTSYGMVNAVSFLGSLVAPPLTGWIKDATGSFAWGCYAAAILCVLGSVVVAGVRPAYRWGPETPFTT